MIVLQFVFQSSFIYFLIPIFCYQLFLIFGAIKIKSNFFVDSISEAITTKNEIALTFDDGPSDNNTNRILDILQQNNIQATFFCIGNRIETSLELIKRIDAENHLIGNHSYSHHFFFDLYSTEKMKAELFKTNDLVHKLIGKKMKFFRPPYGVTNPNLAKAIAELGLHSIGWNIRSMDTVVKVEQKLLSNIIPKLKPGSIVLLHDTAQITVENLQQLIDAIHAKGFKIVRLDKIINIEAYA
jgi:peptidoglycan/xylan/chitin deacetylase (PgdA/CDA1 family)